jgi:hypothetical protein
MLDHQLGNNLHFVTDFFTAGLAALGFICLFIVVKLFVAVPQPLPLVAPHSV